MTKLLDTGAEDTLAPQRNETLSRAETHDHFPPIAWPPW